MESPSQNINIMHNVGKMWEEKKEEVVENDILEAKMVYILMSKDHRISRNRRAEWFFSRFETIITLPQDHLIALALDEGADFYVVSAIPRNPSADWSPQTRHSFRYKITTRTIVTYLSRRYRIVYCIDVSPSVAAVDIQAGSVVFDGVFQALRASLDGLMRPFYIPGSTIVFQPKIFITVITHSPFVTSINNEVILQGKLLGPSTYNDILETVFQRLNIIENKMAAMTESLLKTLTSKKRTKMEKEKTPSGDSKTAFKSSISSDFSLVDLLKQALIALSLLPENSSSGLVILTDGVVSVPDGRYLDIILSQLRYNTVSCSFIQLSSPFHPHLCHGVLPYLDLMKFIASATFGAFLTEAHEIAYKDISEMNVYHSAFLAWSFQSSDNIQGEAHLPASVKPGEWSIRNKCFFTIRDMPIVKKLQFENTLAVDYMKVLSCRLREGFMIKDISLNDDGRYEITLTQEWKFLIHLEYVVVTDKTPDSQTGCILSLEGPYDFLHDVTCLAARSFPSIYRQLMVNRFWATRKNLSESDRLLVHLNSFSSDSAYYNIPDSLRNGVPLFYFSSSSAVPQLQSRDFPYAQFAQFWKPVCMLDTNVWQKWMHTHRIGVILEHDHPLPKHLHCPNSAGRFQVILCRQAIMALNTLLRKSSSFVLVENHSYVTLMYHDDDDKTVPFSFYIIRVTSKPPYVVLRLAFLVGTPGNLRHKTVSSLRKEIGVLTFPQRLKEPPRWRFPSGGSLNPADQANKASWAELPCCILMGKPIEKILIRYEKVPENFCEVLMPQHSYETASHLKSPTTSKQSTFGFKPTHPTPGTTTTIMVPEMFNTVARYLHHRRWIWFLPKCVLPDFSVKDASEILAIITKMRLQEGFRFAYSSSGTVSMVLEVQMENKTNIPTHDLDNTSGHVLLEEAYLTPCVLQFVMFPPTTSLTPQFDDDLETPEESKDLFLITECWIEPQCGKLTGCQFATLNGLEFFEIPDKIFEINKECLLTLGAFDYLRGAPRSNFMDRKGTAGLQRTIAGANTLKDNNTVLLPFDFELGRVLPKCSQTEMLFSMFFQDLRHAFSVEGKNDFVPYHERANEILYNSWTANLAEAHDKEILIDQRYFSSLLTMVLSREDVTKTGKDSKFNYDDLPAWKCFVKSVDPSQQLITLVPKTLRDTKLFFLIVEKCKCVLTAAESRMNENFPAPLHQTQSEMSEGNSGANSTKLRQRKISEPNCCQKSASTSLVSHLSQDNAYPAIGRKRIRALSGGESAPVLKKAFTVDSSLHDSLAQSFFEEAASKYIVPKTKKILVDDLSCSFPSYNERTGPNNRPFSISESGDQFDAADNALRSSMVGSLTMPLFTYDCSLSTLRNYLIYKGNQEIGDRCLDFRIFSVLENEVCNKASDNMNDAASISSSSSECTTPDPRKLQEDLDFTPTQLQDYFKECQLSYKQSFIQSIFHSLQLGYYVSTEDLKAAVNLCQKSVISVDISEFLNNVCCHESLHEPCRTSEKIRTFIQRKFRDILTKRFNCTKVEFDFFYFKSNRLSHSQENVFGDFGSYFSFMEFEDDASRKRESESCQETPTDQWNSSSEFFNFSNISSTARRESENTSLECTLPLFMLLKCTSTTTDGSFRSFPVSDLPVCKDDYDPSCRKEIHDSTDAAEGVSNTKLELLFLTSPLDYVEESSAEEITNIQQCQNISLAQTDALETMLQEIEWLLNDEITSLRSNSLSLTTEMLQEIASHVQRSTGKLGCFQQVIPLKFVENSTKGHEKFIEQFDRLWLPGFGFKKLDNWWYLKSTPEANKILNVDGNSDSQAFDTDRSDSLQRSSDPSESSTACTTSMSETEFHMENHLPFWIIFRVDTDNVFTYCHVRYDEEDLVPLKQCSETRDIILQGISRLIRIVNQDLLLQSLHDTRICSPLLEPDTNRSLDDTLLYGTNNYDDTLRDIDTDSNSTTNTSSTVASFACDVVWETTFKLHPRLKAGPGKSAFSRGMQILRATLMPFEVNNRDNMFVYRNSLGNVFYLRMYRVIESYEDVGTDCPSENPSPRSSISSKSRLHHPSADSNKDDPPIIMLRDVLNNLGGRVTSDGVVLLKVHGVTEAGSEIKEQLIQSLRNKLDDAVLDVLSVTLDRNPHCKLTPEDVHFIQKPLSPPDAVVRFTTGRFVKLLLPPFAFYVHQNLLQFLNIPKYTKGEPEFHFQDYHRITESRLNNEEHNVYLYNQSPGETGSRGVACVSVSLVDRNGTLLRCHDWKLPWNFQFSLTISELATFTETEEILDGTPMSDIVLELCVWKQGRINLDILKNNFLSALKHGGWDLAMEYQILTPSLFSPEAQEDQNTTERNKDLIMGYKLSRCGSPVTSNIDGPFQERSLRRRNSSAVALGKIDNERFDEPRERSWSYTVRRPPALPAMKSIRLEIPLETYNSKSSLRGSTASTETIRSGYDFKSSRRNIIEDIDKLHLNYSSKIKKWVNIGLSLNLPSLRTESIKFKPQHYLDETVEEIIKIIHAASPDNSTAQFWKLEKNMRDFLTVGKKIRPEYENVLHKVYREVNSFKTNEEKLVNLEKKDEAEYPEELLQLFTARECFQPSAKPSSCILIGRNLNHWEACVYNKKSLDIAFNSSDVLKSLYKFYPLMSEATNFNDDKSSLSLNADKLKFPTKNGLLALLGETSEESCLQSILVPRQRFLLAFLSRYSVKFVFYNWSKETSDKVIEHTKILATWNQCRWDLMSSILLQKSGIYYNQPFLREAETANSMTHMHPTAGIKELVRHCYPPKHSVMADRGSNSKNLSDSRAQISDLYRNLHHTHLLRLNDTGMFSPISVHGEQLLELVSQGRNDLESALFRYWLSRGPSASNVIGKEAIEALKQTARMIHYCMTPIFFLPRWRTAISLTRDSTSGIFKRARVVESNFPALMNAAADRTRHTSATSFKSVLSKDKSNLPIWSLWKRLQSERYKDDDAEVGGGVPVARSPKRTSDSWHAAVCSLYIQEYMQYLQTLGFIPAQGINGNAKRQSVLTSDNWAQSYVGRLERMRRMSDGSVLSADSDKSSQSASPNSSINKVQCETEDKVFYLQKSLQGGIILLEVGFVEPFSYCKIHALEVHRIQGNKFAQRAATSHNTIAFVDECDKMKVLMHLHSFAYDFHLRSIQSHICGKQIIKQGYHVTKFLDDFISYYCKGPNFARSTVNIGILSLQNISTPSHIMFDYILTHNKKYEMTVLRMNQLNSNKTPEPVESVAGQGYDYALVYTFSKKVAYRESEDESHLGEFEMSLLISHDVQAGGRGFSKDPSVLRIKYYIVLTSRRELYPNLAGDLNRGKLFPVSAPEPLSDSSAVREIKRKSFDEGGSAQYMIDEEELDTGSFGSEKDYSGSTDSSAHNVIREEKVHYMGYFSSHEQMMQEILKEQTVWAEHFIRKMVAAAAVDCRRDLLWQRLQVGGKQQMTKLTADKDELTLRETVGVLTFWEFSELLELIHVQPLRALDPQLETLLNQPTHFFQTLIKLLSNVSQYEHRYFVAPDGKIHQLVIINPNINKCVILIEINLIRRLNDISILYKDNPEGANEELAPELDQEMLNLIETAVGACCYCNWLTFVR